MYVVLYSCLPTIQQCFSFTTNQPKKQSVNYPSNWHKQNSYYQSMYKANTNSLILNNPGDSNLTERKEMETDRVLHIPWQSRGPPGHGACGVEAACEDSRQQRRNATPPPPMHHAWEDLLARALFTSPNIL